ncbi:cytochrome P450 [Actinoalloteichus caeruleus]|uniref:cytochrome P450 n=1 Tax=Actinoalloteichus cyanogriseus TaxID=2893586 RepID=UPI003BB964E4
MSPELRLPPYTLSRAPGAPFDPPAEHTAQYGDQPVGRVSIWDGRLAVWLVTRYDDARVVLGDRRFSAAHGHPCYPSRFEAEPPRPRVFFSSQDPPEHGALRSLVARDFLARRVTALRPTIQRLADQLLDEMASENPPVDLVGRFAQPLPSLVICDLLGVPYQDHDFFQRAASTVISLHVPMEEKLRSFEALRAFLRDVVNDKRGAPEDDVLSRLAVRVRAGELTAGDAADLGVFLLNTGHETTANMIGLGVAALLDHPDQIPLVVADDDSTARAVEELLRYLTIIHAGQRRFATEDVDLGGVTIRAGDGVVVSLPAANRDPSAFPGSPPDRLDVTRRARHHLAFGHGDHLCLGQQLARAELRIALRSLFERFPGLRLATPLERIPFKHDAQIYGVHALPVRW